MTRLRVRQRVFIGALLLVSLALSLIVSGIYPQLLAGTDKTYEELKLFSDVLDIVEKNYVDPVEPKELIEGAIQGMLGSLDPHSSFLTADAYDELQIDTKGEFSGIGIVITMKENILTVVSPIEGTPAHKAGIKSGDQIIKVDGETTKDMKLWEAVKKIRGEKGTEVLITVMPKGAEEPKELKIVRDVIPLESVHSHVLKPGYAYLRITNFRDNTYDDAKAALGKLESEQPALEGLILDLRDNPGGLLDQSVKVADLFLEEGDIVSIKGRSESQSKTYSARRDGEKRPYPIVLLINEGSASASEIVAGALQDHKRALILGTTSFGKGSVQTVEPLRDGYGLKLTIARYYTPKGNAIQAQGISPDVVVERRFLAEEEETSEHFLHEKDLKNHISAEPQGAQSEESKEPDDTEAPDTEGLEPKEEVQQLLTKDNQVGTALDILASWKIFSQMGL
jgi:carboxyl-terminal processing protease